MAVQVPDDSPKLRFDLKRAAAAGQAKPPKAYSEDERLAVVEDVLAAMCDGKLLEETVKPYQLRAGEVRRWIVRDEELLLEYERAKILMGQCFVEEAVRIARDATMKTTSIAKIRIDALQWAAARLNRPEFGQQQQINRNEKRDVTVRVVEEDPSKLLQ